MREMTDPTVTSGAIDRRYHGLDFLRASMMLLGVVLHVVITYWVYPDDSVDLRSPDNPFSFVPYRNGDRGETVEGILVLIHFFRMPAFYLLAGFFGALLIDRRGPGRYLWNRTTRILLPFVIGWFVLWPLTRFSFGLGHSMMYPGDGEASLARAFSENPFWSHLPFMGDWPHDLMHLWFLHYLVLFYVVTAPVALWLDRPGGPLRAAAHRVTRTLLVGDLRWLRLPILVGVTALATLLQDAPGLKTSFQFVPDAAVFSVYFVFFIVGWLFYAHREIVGDLDRRAGLHTLAGFALMFFVVYPMGTNWNFAATDADLWFGSRTLQLRIYWIIHSVAMWLAILGLMGLSERVFKASSPTIRYVVDASYWIYLIHFPIAALVPVLFHQWDLDADLKMWVMTLIVSAICFVSYHYLVRSTVIGRCLNGRRYSRDLPWRQSASTVPGNVGSS